MWAMAVALRGRVVVLGVVEIAPRVRPAAEFDDGAGLEKMIVDVECVGVEVAAIVVIFQKRIDAGGGVIAPKANTSKA